MEVHVIKILIVYGTTEGQTRKISERIVERIREMGHDAELHDSTSLPADLNVDVYDAVIVAASIHQQSYQAPVVHFVTEYCDQVQTKPSAFLSVGLSHVFEDDQHEAQGCVDQFLSDTGWRPTQTELVAGALLYTQYDFFKRQIMKLIVWKGGGPTDASQDHEFTDWDALLRFVKSFLKMAGRGTKTA